MAPDGWKTSGPGAHHAQPSGSGRMWDGGGGRELVLVKPDSLLSMTKTNGSTLRSEGQGKGKQSFGGVVVSRVRGAIGLLGETFVDRLQILTGCADGVHVRQANSEGCGDVCLQNEGSATEVSHGFILHDFAVGGGIPSQHKFFSESGLKGLEKGLSVKPLVNQNSDVIAGIVEEKANSFKDIHTSPGKVDYGIPAELESDEEDGSSNDSLGLSAEVRETEVRTIN
ncbi:hypothetical protein SUGI_1072120 [Cryptomeria japonica]|nr:hypothetical protein SUGI_1072120 [Cryptomeria japonica]